MREGADEEGEEMAPYRGVHDAQEKSQCRDEVFKIIKTHSAACRNVFPNVSVATATFFSGGEGMKYTVRRLLIYKSASLALDMVGGVHNDSWIRHLA